MKAFSAIEIQQLVGAASVEYAVWNNVMAYLWYLSMSVLKGGYPTLIADTYSSIFRVCSTLREPSCGL